MSRRSIPLALSLAVPLSCGWQAMARAQPAVPSKPAMRPNRDVDVTYAMVPAGQPDALRQRMRWHVADQVLRVDPPMPGLYMLVDYRARRMEMVREADRKLIVLADGGSRLPGETPGGDYRRRGSDKVAGLACTEWDLRDNADQPVTLCVTDDGVMLRAQAGPRVMAEAVRVQYGPQAPSVFAPPPGYETVRAEPVAKPPPQPAAPQSPPTQPNAR